MTVELFIISVARFRHDINKSCNHTSWEWTDVKGKNSDVSAQSRALLSE